MTAIANTVFTAAQFNTHVRDNLLETAPAKATAAGQIFVATGLNSIAARVPSGAKVDTSETTTSTAFTDLATVGPAVTVTTGTRAIIMTSCTHANNTANGASATSFEVSGATTSAAASNRRTLIGGVTANNELRFGQTFFFDTLNAGSNTFTMKYSVGGGTTGTFRQREIVVIPL